VGLLADRRGRSNAHRLVGQGYYQDLQSHVVLNGEPVPILELLKAKGKKNVSDIPGWMNRIPIQHWWLQSSVTRENVEDVLRVLSDHELEWFSNVIALTTDQVGSVVDVVKEKRKSILAPSALFALNGSKIWAKVKVQTLLNILVADSPVSGHAELVFEQSRYPGVSTPQALKKAAERIMKKEARVHFSVALAAAKFASENKSTNQLPLRETVAFPSW
jgi:hypothetical protein